MDKLMKELDVLSAPLEGSTLIEASAGTGKTWSITGLFLRLLLEKHFTVYQILVVTFTNAATEELRMKIRERLNDARRAFLTGNGCDDLMVAMVGRYGKDRLAIPIIDGALREFDQAAIFTIHGFCHNLLNECAFETGNPFDAELIPNRLELVREVCDDFWRIHLYPAPPEFAAYCLEKMNGPNGFLGMLMRNRWPEIKILPGRTNPFLSTLDPFRALLDRMKTSWPDCKEDVRSSLANKALKQNIYSKKKGAVLIEAMDEFLEKDSIGFPFFENFERFTPARLTEAVRKEDSIPIHPFFNMCTDLWNTGKALETEMQNRLLFLKTELFSFASGELVRRKQKRRIRFYDDLLMEVRRTIRGAGGNRLIKSVSRRYHAALVDEFQDTDPIQYEIFSRLFAGKGRALFMIGDPKQAIYGFRGADLFSYMKASENARDKYTLTCNYRSVPKLIRAVNTLFGNIRHPFLFNEILFHEGKAVVIDEADGMAANPPFKIWFVPGKESKPLSKEEAARLISSGVCAEIMRLLKTQPLQPKDIAILVRTHRQARIMKEALTLHRIPAVLYSDETVFDSHEAQEMERLLRGIQDPLYQPKVKAALITDMMGWNAKNLDPGKEENHSLEETYGRFREYHEVWRTEGFAPMFGLLMKQEHVKEHLVRFPNGERRLTNLLHLTELLHQASTLNGFTMERLTQWISEQQVTGNPRMEEHQLRLESDEDAVTITTVHKSKGLEYPVVFCPFSWEGLDIGKGELVFHDEHSDREMVLDLNPEASLKNVFLAEKELLAENIRLLYVALTRAKKRCYLVWGKINSAQSSAMVYLFHSDQPSNSIDPSKSIKETLSGIFYKKRDSDLLADLKTIARKSNGCIEIDLLPKATETIFPLKEKLSKALACRTFSGTIPSEWKVTSYSSLVSGKMEYDELPDRDLPSAPSSDDEDETMLPFPKGLRAGLFFHKLFETLEFTLSPHQQQDRVIAALESFGFESTWAQPVTALVKQVLSSTLSGAAGDLTLSTLPASDRIHEVEFYFPLNRIGHRDLKAAFGEIENTRFKAGFPERLGDLVFTPREGFMKGFIDLLARQNGRYYLIDWKSNFLGPDASWYRKERLDRVIEETYYFLQYHLYVLAVYRYLKMRQPDFKYERDFGGVFYLFIRGIDPDQGNETGIYYDLPDLKRIEALEKTLIPPHHI